MSVVGPVAADGPTTGGPGRPGARGVKGGLEGRGAAGWWCMFSMLDARPVSPNAIGNHFFAFVSHGESVAVAQGGGTVTARTGHLPSPAERGSTPAGTRHTYAHPRGGTTQRATGSARGQAREREARGRRPPRAASRELLGGGTPRVAPLCRSTRRSAARGRLGQISGLLEKAGRKSRASAAAQAGGAAPPALSAPPISRAISRLVATLSLVENLSRAVSAGGADSGLRFEPKKSETSASTAVLISRSSIALPRREGGRGGAGAVRAAEIAGG